VRFMIASAYLALMTSASYAENAGVNSAPIHLHGPCGGADEVSIREEGAGLVLTYVNDALGTSDACIHEVTVPDVDGFGDVTIRFRIYINVSGSKSERIEILELPEGLAAIPEFMDVEDGQETDIAILPMMF